MAGTTIATAFVQIEASARGITANIEKELKPLGTAADDAGTKAGKGFGERFQAGAGASLDKFGKVALVGAAALGVGLLGVAKSAGNLEAAIAANEQVLGDASQAVQTWAKDSVTNVGLSERAALEAATAFGQLAKVSGLAGPDVAAFSEQFVVLAADMAAFKDVPVDQALADLQAGFAGQTEVLRKYGIFLDDATIKTGYFNETGEKVTGTLTAQQRILGTQNAIMAATGDIQGQAGRESDGFARAQDNLKASLENASASIGTTVLPAMTSLITFAATLATGFGALNDATGGAIGTIGLFATAGLGAAGAIALVVSKVGGVISTFQNMSSAARIASVSMGAVGVVLIGAAVLYAKYSGDKAKAKAATDDFVTALKAEQDGQAGATTAMIAARLSTEGNLDAIAKSGISHKDLARFIMGESVPAIDAFMTATATGPVLTQIGALEDLGMGFGTNAEQARGLAVELDTLRGAYETAPALLEAMNAATDETTTAMSGATAATGSWLPPLFSAAQSVSSLGSGFDILAKGARGAARGLGEVADEAPPTLDVISDAEDALNDAADAASGFADALDTVFGDAPSVQAAGDAVRDNVVALTKAMEENGKTLDENTEAGRANRSQLRESVKGIEENAVAMAANGSTTEEVTAVIGLQRAQLVQQAMDFGMTEAEADAYVSTLGLTPETVSTAVELAGVEAAKLRIQETIDRLGEIPASTMTWINAAIDRGDYDAAERQLAQLERNRSMTLRVQTVITGMTGAISNAIANGAVVSSAGRFVPGGTNMLSSLAEISGSRGDEVVLPLGDPARMASLLGMPEVFGRVLAAMPMASPRGSDGASIGGGITVNNNRRDFTPNDMAQTIQIARLQMA